MKFASVYILLLLLLSSAAFASNITTQGGNITGANLQLGNATSLWHGVYGMAFSTTFFPITINATPGGLSNIGITTGTASCAHGVSVLALLFSSSSGSMTSLAPGNLSQLDLFINSSNQNGSVTFTSLSQFNTSTFGNISGVPTAYTEPSSSQKYRMGFLQDQSGNFVFVTVPSYGSTGFTGGPVDYQIILPTNGTAASYFYAADLLCNAAPPVPPVPPTPSPTYTVSPGSSIKRYLQPPPINISPEPPVLEQLRILSFTSFQEVYAGQRILINPLFENPTNRPIEISIGLSGAAAGLSTPAKNILIGAKERRTVPFEVRIPSDMPQGYYSLTTTVSSGNSSISFPSILHVLPPYKVGEPVVTRDFKLDYEAGITQISLTIFNPSDDQITHLQLLDAIPSSLVSRLGRSTLVSGVSLSGADQPGYVEGASIRWEVQGISGYESRVVSYLVPILLLDMSDYSAWNLAQIAVIDSSGAVQIRDLQIPSVSPGGKAEVNLNVFNAGAADQDVMLTIASPAGWTATPNAMSFSAVSRQATPLSFILGAPNDANAGTYGFILQLSYAGKSYQQQAYIYVNKPLLQLYAPPISSQFLAFLEGNAVPVFFVILVSMLIAAALYFAYRFLNAPRFDADRLEDMKNMEQMFNQKVIGKKKRL